MLSAAPAAELDHLVVAGATLAQAIEYVADLTGVAPRPGGQHTAMGTHNALVRLGRRVYLEHAIELCWLSYDGGGVPDGRDAFGLTPRRDPLRYICLLYTSDAADE